MAVWNGVPLNSAILVRHESHGALSSKGEGGRKAIEYMARDGDYRERGDIDREPTERDLELARDERDRTAERALDYIGREGEFASKGADRQIDASLWGESGPVDIKQATRELQRSETYMHSIVTVDRRYAEQLGLDSKAAMQELVRSTWRESAERWQAFGHPEDIRWVAAFHSDAEHSYHCHVYTYSARPNDIEKGHVIDRERTRDGKEVVLGRGYREISKDRNERDTFLRGLGRQNMARQLGGKVDQEMVRRLHRQAQQRGWPERVPDAPDYKREDAAGLDKLRAALREKLEKGEGRLSKNYAAGSDARKIVRELERISPATQAIRDGLRECSEAKAEIKGYDSEKWLKRQDMVRHDRLDYLDRMVPTVERAHLRGASRDRSQERDVGRDRGFPQGRARNSSERARAGERRQEQRERKQDRQERSERVRDGSGRSESGYPMRGPSDLGLASALASIASAAAQGGGASGGKLSRQKHRHRGGYDVERDAGRR